MASPTSTAPSVTERVERLLGAFGLKSQQVASPTDVGGEDRSLATFVAGNDWADDG